MSRLSLSFCRRVLFIFAGELPLLESVWLYRGQDNQRPGILHTSYCKLSSWESGFHFYFQEKFFCVVKTDRITGRAYENCYLSPRKSPWSLLSRLERDPRNPRKWCVAVLVRTGAWLSASSLCSLCPPFSKQNPKNLGFAPHRCSPVLRLQAEFLLENRFVLGQGQHGVVTRFLTGASSGCMCRSWLWLVATVVASISRFPQGLWTVWLHWINLVPAHRHQPVWLGVPGHHITVGRASLPESSAFGHSVDRVWLILNHNWV